MVRKRRLYKLAFSGSLHDCCFWRASFTAVCVTIHLQHDKIYDTTMRAKSSREASQRGWLVALILLVYFAITTLGANSEFSDEEVSIIGSPEFLEFRSKALANVRTLMKASLVVKRSLCNTFTGCGRKRSAYTHQAILEAPSTKAFARQQQAKRDESKLVAEALTNLIEYLRVNDPNRVTKYLVPAPRHFMDSTKTSLSANDFAGISPSDWQPNLSFLTNQQEPENE